MDKTVALMFVSSFAIQQLVGLADFVFAKIRTKEARKNAVTAVSTAIGLLIAFIGEMKLPESIIAATHPYLNHAVVGVVIGSGTEGVNSMLKYLAYAKDQRGQAAEATKVLREKLTQADPKVVRGLVALQ